MRPCAITCRMPTAEHRRGEEFFHRRSTADPATQAVGLLFDPGGCRSSDDHKTVEAGDLSPREVNCFRLSPGQTQAMVLAQEGHRLAVALLHAADFVAMRVTVAVCDDQPLPDQLVAG